MSHCSSDPRTAAISNRQLSQAVNFHSASGIESTHEKLPDRFDTDPSPAVFDNVEGFAADAPLVSMLYNVTICKKAYEAVVAEMNAVRDESERWRLRLTVMAAKDVAAFDRQLIAHKLAKASDEDKAWNVYVNAASLKDRTFAEQEITKPERGRVLRSQTTPCAVLFVTNWVKGTGAADCRILRADV